MGRLWNAKPIPPPINRPRQAMSIKDASILVGKASNGDQEYRIHQVIGIEDPTGREQVCLQVGLDAWYGDIHDGHVEHGHEKTKEYCCQDKPGFNGFRTYHQYWRRCVRSPAPKRC